MTRPGLIDVHAHVCPLSFPDSPSIAAREKWPCMRPRNPHEAAIVLGGEVFRELDDRSWSAARRIEDMDRDGVAMQVLSPMPELLSYWFSADDAGLLADHVNAEIAAMRAVRPDRFRGLGMAPLQDAARAVSYLGRLRERFDLDGLEIGSHVAGAMLGNPRFEPFWEAVENLGLCVFIHPLHPLTQRLEAAPALLHPLAGFLSDTAIAGASLLMAGVLERHPRLSIGLSHGGGGLAPVVPRLDQAWRTMPGFAATLSRPPSEQARALFYDSNVYDARFLKYLAETFAPGRVFVGTDYPYQIMQAAPADYLAAADLCGAAHESVARGAALAFLGLTAEDA